MLHYPLVSAQLILKQIFSAHEGNIAKTGHSLFLETCSKCLPLGQFQEKILFSCYQLESVTIPLYCNCSMWKLLIGLPEPNEGTLNKAKSEVYTGKSLD